MRRVSQRGLAIGRIILFRSGRAFHEITRIAWRDKREGDQKCLGAAEEKVHLQPVAAGIQQGLRHATINRAAGAFWRCSAAAEGRPLRPLPGSGRDGGGRTSRPRQLHQHERALQAVARRAECRPPEPCQHGLRHRQTQRARRIHAGRRHVCRAPEPADRSQARHCPQRAPPEHQRVLRRRAESDVEPEGAEARGEDQRRARRAQQGQRTKVR